MITFTCTRCHRTSANPNDVREGYCGACHDWTGYAIGFDGVLPCGCELSARDHSCGPSAHTDAPENEA